MRLSADFSSEPLQARREWHNIFKVIKGKNLQPRILYPARFSFKFNGEIKALQTSKSLSAPANHHHQTNYTPNAKGTLAGKETSNLILCIYRLLNQDSWE